jgi:hypothetical protein
MQLIEIIQLALLIFIAISLVIFLFSYLGYRTKSNIEEAKKTMDPDKKVIVSDTKIPDLQKVNVLPKSKNELPKHDAKFRVFNPPSDDKSVSQPKIQKNKNVHTPRTLIIKKKH